MAQLKMVSSRLRERAVSKKRWGAEDDIQYQPLTSACIFLQTHKADPWAGAEAPLVEYLLGTHKALGPSPAPNNLGMPVIPVVALERCSQKDQEYKIPLT